MPSIILHDHHSQPQLPGEEKALITIPAFNEEKRIKELLQHLISWRDRVVVVDDGSTDATHQVVELMGFRCLRQEKNAGLTSAYAAAEEFAQSHGYSHILALDADGQHDPACIPEFLSTLAGYDLVSGNRFYDPEHLPEAKIASNLFAILLFGEALGRLLPDVSCGFRGWRTGVFFDHGNGSAGQASGSHFGIVYEMLLKHVSAGKQVGFVQIPAIYHRDEPPGTKVAEIIGLLTAINRFPVAREIRALPDLVISRKEFMIHLRGIRFEASPVSDDSYLFATDINKAKNFLKTINNHLKNEC